MDGSRKIFFPAEAPGLGGQAGPEMVLSRLSWTLGESTCISGRLGGPLMLASGINLINAVPPHRRESIRGDD